jgi:hypothetical protein
VRADDHPSQQIAENDRLVQSLEHHCRNRSDAQNYREILKEGVRIHQAEFTLVGRPFFVMDHRPSVGRGHPPSHKFRKLQRREAPHDRAHSFPIARQPRVG